MSKTGVLLINLGTPDDAKIGMLSDIYRILNDPQVIDILLARKLLVNLIIVPFESGFKSKIYKRIVNGQKPCLALMYHIESVKEKNQLGGEFGVHFSHALSKSSLEKVLGK